MTQRTIQNRGLLATCWTWSGNSAPAVADEMSPLSIEERVRAGREAGWEGVGIVHADLVRIRDGIGYPALRRLLDDNGVHHVELEFITNWWADGSLRTASDVIRRDLFAAAADLRVETIKVAAQLTSFGAAGAPVPMEQFAHAFDALAADAAEHGVRVAVEPMPMSNLRSIGEGAELVRSVSHPNGGLVVDSWHVSRGGTAYEDLERVLDIDQVFVVELADADRDVRGSLWDDAVHNRRNPGEGDLGMPAFVATMHRAGWRGIWGVEIISDDQRALPVTEAVARTRDATLSVLDAADLLLAENRAGADMSSRREKTGS